MTVGSTLRSRNRHPSVGRTSVGTHERYHHHNHHSRSSSSNLAVCVPTSSCFTSDSDYDGISERPMAPSDEDVARRSGYGAGVMDACQRAFDRIRHMDMPSWMPSLKDSVNRLKNIHIEVQWPKWMQSSKRIIYVVGFTLVIAGLMFLAAYSFCRFVCEPRQRKLLYVFDEVVDVVLEALDSAYEHVMSVPRRIFC